MPTCTLQALEEYLRALDTAVGPLRGILGCKIALIHDNVGVQLFNAGV